MPKKHKKKKNVQPSKLLKSDLVITKTYFDDFVKTAHKFMLLIGLQPSAFDALSKRTKHNIMQIRHTPYRIRAEDNRVPAVYLKMFNSVMSNSERTTFYGDPIYKITFLEYVTYGLSLIYSFRMFESDETHVLEDQIELMNIIKTPLLKYDDEHEDDFCTARASGIMKSIFLYITKLNYRFYTCKENAFIDYSKGRMENGIIVSSIQPERKKFIIDGKTHSSYRLGYYNLLLNGLTVAPEMAEISLKLLTGDNKTTSKQLMNQINIDTNLPVFIQNHALNRAAERMDSKDNMYLNLIFFRSFLLPRIITAVNGQRLITVLDYQTGNPIGYFPFVKQDGAVLILSFLPLSSPITPEGSVLHKELGIQLEDSKYIGLDKFSFYTKTDFDTLPKLKLALKKAGMWHLTELTPINPMERKEDHILKNFFTNNTNEPEFIEEYN